MDTIVSLLLLLIVGYPLFAVLRMLFWRTPVRRHTRRTASGKLTTVRSHTRRLHGF